MLINFNVQKLNSFLFFCLLVFNNIANYILIHYSFMFIFILLAHPIYKVKIFFNLINLSNFIIFSFSFLIFLFFFVIISPIFLMFMTYFYDSFLFISIYDLIITLSFMDLKSQSIFFIFIF
jgi:hypothetical protein